MAIYNIINPIVDSYANHYPKDKDKIYPYAEFKITNSVINNEYSNNWLLTIDIWNNNSDDLTQIESITDSIFESLNYQKMFTNNLFIQVYRNNPFILNIPDEDLEIQRRQVKMICKIYNKGDINNA